MSQELGKTLIILGALAIVAGLVILYRDRIPGLEHFGRLPGDIAIEQENVKFYFPLTTSILISLILSLLFWISSKF